MSNELSDAAASAATFSPQDYLLGIVQRSVTAGESVRIALPGNGEIILLPAHNAFHAAVRDMAEFCRSPAALFELTPVAGDVSPSSFNSVRGIKDLLWQASFHASEGRLPHGCSRYDVVQFRYWPNLTRLSSTPNAARISALLTRHPTTIMLVHRLLGITKEEVCQVYSAAHSAGIAYVAHSFGRNPELASVEAGLASIEASEEVIAKAAAPSERGLFRALFAKISGL